MATMTVASSPCLSGDNFPLKFTEPFPRAMLTLKDWQGSHLQWLSLLLPHPHPGLPVEDGQEDELEDEDF